MKLLQLLERKEALSHSEQQKQKCMHIIDELLDYDCSIKQHISGEYYVSVKLHHIEFAISCNTNTSKLEGMFEAIEKVKFKDMSHVHNRLEVQNTHGKATLLYMYEMKNSSYFTVEAQWSHAEVWHVSISDSMTHFDSYHTGSDHLAHLLTCKSGDDIHVEEEEEPAFGDFMRSRSDA